MLPNRRRHPVVVALALTGLVLSISAPATAADGPALEQQGTDVLARDSWIVTLVPDADPAADAAGLAQAAGGRIGNVYRQALLGFQFHGSAQAASALEELVVHAEQRLAEADSAGVVVVDEDPRARAVRIASVD